MSAVRWRPAGRIWNLLLAVLIVVAVVVQITMVVRGQHVLVAERGGLPAIPTRVIRFLSYFTIQSNILVAVTGIWLVWDVSGTNRFWQVLRQDALVGITITGVIYVTLLRPLVDLHGVARLTDIAFHYVAPIGALVGWVLFGPRGRISDRVLAWSLIWPALYIGYTLAHGAAGSWYPYPFIDVGTLGYAVALRNGLGITVLILGVGVLFRWADRYLPDRTGAAEVPRPATAI
jgi:hypothetical protein